MKRYRFNDECSMCPNKDKRGDGICNGDCMAPDPDGEWVRYEDISVCPPADQIAEAVTVARLPLLQAIRDLEEQVKVLRENSERKSKAIHRIAKFVKWVEGRHA